MVSLRTAMAGTRLKLQEKDGYVFLSHFGYDHLPCCHVPGIKPAKQRSDLKSAKGFLSLHETSSTLN